MFNKGLIVEGRVPLPKQHKNPQDFFFGSNSLSTFFCLHPFSTVREDHSRETRGMGGRGKSCMLAFFFRCDVLEKEKKKTAHDSLFRCELWLEKGNKEKTGGHDLHAFFRECFFLFFLVMLVFLCECLCCVLCALGEFTESLLPPRFPCNHSISSLHAIIPCNTFANAPNLPFASPAPNSAHATLKERITPME